MSITLKGISKRYNGRTVLKNVNLDIKQGEFHVLLGLNGEGKTTTLSIIAGLVSPDSGSVFVGNKDVTNLSPDKRKIGFVFQDHALFPHLTVFENIAFGLRVRKIKEKMIRRKVDYCVRSLGLSSERDNLPGRLSGGQKQRVALARALIIEPEVLLMDEPMSNLDAIAKKIMRDELKCVQQNTGLTTVYVTHDQDEAAFFGDGISVLNNGMVRQIGNLSEMFHHSETEFVPHFVGFLDSGL